MTGSIRLVVAAIAILVAIFATAPSSATAADLEISGEVTYRERIALPPDALLKIELLDLTADDMPVRASAEATIGKGQVPLQFVLSVSETVLTKGHDYALVASIVAADQLWFRNQQPYRLNPLLPEIPVVIIVDFAGGLTPEDEPETVVEPEPPAELEVSAEIFDTVWNVVLVKGKAPADGVQSTLSITTDRRAGGIGGCNNWFAEAYFGAPAALSFGDVVSTRMACADDAMGQESAFFAAITSVRLYELDGAMLYLLDPDGNLLLTLIKADAN